MRGLLRAAKRLTGGPLAAALEAVLRRSSRRVGVALVYHAVAERPGDPAEILPAHGTVAFATQLEHLRRRYRVVPATELLSAVAGRARGERFPVAITFDDDLPSHAEVAAPLLRRLSLPATFFLSGASLSGPFSFWWERLQRAVDTGVADASIVPLEARTAGPPDLRPGSPEIRQVAERIERLPAQDRDRMSAALAARLGPDPPGSGLRATEVEALSAGGFEVGFHTRRHHLLTGLDDAGLSAAMRGGREELARATGAHLTTIGYPHGKADGRVATAARAADFSLGFTVRRAPVRPSSDPLLVPRIQPTHASLGHFALELVGTLARSPARRTG